MVIVVDFSHAHGTVSKLAKPNGHVLCLMIGLRRRPGRIIVDAGCRRIHARHKRCARRVTQCHLTVSVAEQHTLMREPIKIRSLRIRVAFQAADPIV